MFPAKSYEQLNEYRLYNKSDMIDLTRIILNEYCLADREYNRIINIIIGGRVDIYSSDLISLCHSFAQESAENIDTYYAGHLASRRFKWYIRLYNPRN